LIVLAFAGDSTISKFFAMRCSGKRVKQKPKPARGGLVLFY
jgi:hypothetical protein